MKTFLGLLFGLALSLVPVASFAEEIIIGVLTDLTGHAANYGQETRAGVSLAEEEIRQEGGSIRVVIEDHGLDVKRAVSAAQKLVHSDRVQAVFSNFSATSVATSPTFANAKIPFVYASAATSPLRTNPYALKTFLDFDKGCEALGRRWKVSGLSKVGILKVANEAGELCYEGLLRVFPDLTVLDYNPAEKVNSHALVMKQRGVEAVMNASYEADLLNMLKAFTEIGYRPVIGTARESVTQRVRAEYWEFVKSGGYFGLPQTAAVFRKKLEQRGELQKLSGTSHAAIAYLHLHQLYRALTSCPKNDGGCVVSKIGEAKPDSSALEFSGFSNRVAGFPPYVHTGSEIDWSVD